ncbi:hypothetical protein TRFO_41230 [Tritrichomonas foetus]|uniref:Uncharacterized protein n=1 Tax=Tritrichomonas foetus TaxID=1144522 RepID=A0A1J4L198_9EUKA|nr:hypothetical protein TRFO_41230 [Tritrichomonas foetus]|eukprot:OHT17186.1 hypothetical protein TRFO_41230 [Tritrichomonas foetus]
MMLFAFLPVFLSSISIPSDATPVKTDKFIFTGLWGSDPADDKYWSKETGATATYKFIGTKFWVTGSIKSAHRKLEVFVNGQSVTVINQEGSPDQNKYVFFESKVYPEGELEVKFVAKENPIEFSTFYIYGREVDPPTPAPTSRPFLNDNEYRMWYDTPSSKLAYPPVSRLSDNEWAINTLPIGNSYMGANIYGEIQTERLTFNEKTLWQGGPSSKRPNYNGGNLENQGQNGTVFRRIQQLFREGKDTEASNECDKLTGEQKSGGGYGQYVLFGEIKFAFKDINEAETTNYVRYLDLDQAISIVQFDYRGSTLTREYFMSYPDNVMIIRFNSSKGVIPEFEADLLPTFKANKTASINNDNPLLTVKGRLEDNQMIFNQQMLIKNEGKSEGTITSTSENKLKVSGATDIVIYISAATDYKYVYPNYRTGESEDSVNSRVNKLVMDAKNAGYSTVRARHLDDYTKLFNRAILNLNQKASTIPTNQQLSKYNSNSGKTQEDRDLEILLFQYGRYLTIASSRIGTLPSNLQGVWNNDYVNVVWASDYHMNVNLQMNYWPTYVTNLAECAIPLIEYVEGLRIPGRITAKIYCGVESNESYPENGFSAHTQNTPFGWTCPGWKFSWGWSPGAVPWILQNVFDYYLYTKDEKILKEQIYPMMKECAIFYDQIMVEDSTGRLVSSPTFSPEHGPRTNGNVYEQELIWQHYHNTIKSARILNVDSDLITKWSEKIERLKPIEIGDSGQIKEWYHETTLGSVGTRNHRHMSHLLGLYPGDLINFDTKEWMAAAIISLNDRGDQSTGWGMGQRINSWARTGDGNHAHKLIKSLFKNGIYNNLWDTHPPFQIDGNFGATSGIAEMLLQSNIGYINILPSLPDIWDQGSFDGFIARGNVVVGCDWNEHKATEIRLSPRFNGDIVVQYDGIAFSKIKNSKNEDIKFTVNTGNRITFSGVADEKYTITGFNSDIPEPPSSATIVNPSDFTFSNVEDWEKLENGAYQSKVAGATMTYQFTGSCIWVEGAFGPQLKNMYIYIDDVLYGSISEEFSNYIQNILLFRSNSFNNGEHTVKIVSGPEPIEVSKLYYVGIFIPSSASAVPTSEFKFDSKWQSDSDGRHWSTSDGATVTYTFTGVQFWLTGTMDPNHKIVEIYVDGKLVKELSQQSETRITEYPFYQSDILLSRAGEHTIKIVAKESPIEISKIYVITEEPTPKPTEEPTPKPTENPTVTITLSTKPTDVPPITANYTDIIPETNSSDGDNTGNETNGSLSTTSLIIAVSVPLVAATIIIVVIIVVVIKRRNTECLPHGFDKSEDQPNLRASLRSFEF